MFAYNLYISLHSLIFYNIFYWNIADLQYCVSFRCTEHQFSYIYVYVCSVTSVVSNSLWSYRLQPTRLLCPWEFQGKNTGVGCHTLLQGIFLTQGSNWHFLPLLHCRQILSHWAMGEAHVCVWGYIHIFSDSFPL